MLYVGAINRSGSTSWRVVLCEYAFRGSEDPAWFKGCTLTDNLQRTTFANCYGRWWVEQRRVPDRILDSLFDLTPYGGANA